MSGDQDGSSPVLESQESPCASPEVSQINTEVTLEQDQVISEVPKHKVRSRSQMGDRRVTVDEIARREQDLFGASFPPVAMDWKDRIKLERAAKERGKQAKKAERALKAKNEMRENYMQRSKHLWTSSLIPNWKTKRNLRSTERACFTGIPPSIRPQVWALMLGNRMKVTYQLYVMLRVHAKAIQTDFRNGLEWPLQPMHDDDEETLLDPESSSDDEGFVSEDRDFDSEDSAEENALKAVKGSTESNVVDEQDADRKIEPSTPPFRRTHSHSTMKHIEVDIPRTFPELGFFQANGPYADALQEILEAYVCFRPDIGYVQGMSYIGAMLLLYMDTFPAFRGLANLLECHVFFDYIRLDSDFLRRHLRLFQDLFQENLPVLFAHFHELGIEPDLYLLDWLLTLFAKSLPTNVSARVWDCYLVHDSRKKRELFIWRASLGLLKLLQPKLLGLPFEEVLRMLNRCPNVNEHEYFQHIASVKIPNKRFLDLRKRWDVEDLERARKGSLQVKSPGFFFKNGLWRFPWS